MLSDGDDMDMFSYKNYIKEENSNSPFMEPNCMDNIMSENWLDDDNMYKSEIFDDMLKMDNNFDLMEAIPSSPSDSGMSSAQSFSCEQQLSPLLSLEEPCELMESSELDSMPGLDSPLPLSSNISLSPVASPEPQASQEDLDLTNAIANLAEPKNVVTPQPVQPTIVLTPEPNAKTDNLVSLHNAVNIAGKRNVRQVIRVTPMGSGNPRSILLPVSLVTGNKDMKEVRTIKIINAAQAKNFKSLKINQANILSKNVHVSAKQNHQLHDDSGNEKFSGVSSEEILSECDLQYPLLKLSAEEKRLLQKEGIVLPSHYPLTKHEERELKRIRRKIRNKISAQDSRKRKKEYVDGLEDRVKQCHEENVQLLKRINDLQKDNQSLVGQVKRLQAFIQKENKNAQPSTCLLVLLLSLALVAAPNLRPYSDSNGGSELQDQDQDKISSLGVRSRNLLSTRKFIEEEFQHYSEESMENVDGLLRDHDYAPVVQGPPNKKVCYGIEASGAKLSPPCEHSKSDFFDIQPGGKYIEPPLDDVWPPPKSGVTVREQRYRKMDKLEALTNELKLNMSDLGDEPHSVLLQIPQEQ